MLNLEDDNDGAKNKIIHFFAELNLLGISGIFYYTTDLLYNSLCIHVAEQKENTETRMTKKMFQVESKEKRPKEKINLSFAV